MVRFHSNLTPFDQFDQKVTFYLGSFNASYGMAGNLSKIIQSLPPQIRDNPAALAQLMHSNPLFGLQAAGLHAQAAAVSGVGAAHASATNSPLGNLFKLDEQLEEEKQKLNEAIREQSKPHALNLLQQQQVNRTLKLNNAPYRVRL